VFEVVDPRTSDAQSAMALYFSELNTRFLGGFDARAGGTSTDAEQLRAPSGAFVVMRADLSVIGCGGVQRLDDSTGEMKRMWVDSTWRGVGLGRKLLTHLELQALGLGYSRVVLDTNGTLVEAVAMYERCGYDRIERYNDNPYAHHWFAKALL
jgi:GNAT superfamily N-acetyltransferase